MLEIERQGTEIDPAGALFETTTQDDTLGLIRAMAKQMEIMLPPSAMKVFARQVREMYADDVAPDVITAAAMLALRRGKPHLCQVIALDLQLAASGARMSNAEYEAHLALYAASRKPMNLYAEQQRRAADRQAETDRRRGGGS